MLMNEPYTINGNQGVSKPRLLALPDCESCGEVDYLTTFEATVLPLSKVSTLMKMLLVALSTRIP